MANKQESQQFKSLARYIMFSPYKLRPIVDVIRGKGVDYALNWLATYKTQRCLPIQKVLKSAAANAKQQGIEELDQLIIKEIKVDQGPTHKYFKPGAMGKASVQRRRLSHISVILESKQ